MISPHPVVGAESNLKVSGGAASEKLGCKKRGERALWLRSTLLPTFGERQGGGKIGKSRAKRLETTELPQGDKWKGRRLGGSFC